MDVREAVSSRRSIRAFLPDPVDPAIIRCVLENAARAPSGGNLQPWHVEVIGGEALSALKARVAGRWINEETPEYRVYPENLPDPYETRRRGVGEAMYGAIGISREDRAARREWFFGNFRFFDAPVALFIHTPKLMGPPQWSDMGMFLQTVMLLLRSENLDSCAQECWSSFPDTVKREIGIPDNHILFCGMAIGYRDPGAPVNQFPVERAPVKDFVRFHGI
ncbi:MAG: nitroreductase [Sphingomonadaceae bacterium]